MEHLPVHLLMARKKDYSWRHYLPRSPNGASGAPAAAPPPTSPTGSRSPARPPPTALPLATGRVTWHFGNHGPALLALSERHSRLLLARLPGSIDVTADTIARLLAPLPPEWRQTITFDNGEFNYRLDDLLLRYLSPWQKGGVENDRAYAPTLADRREAFTQPGI